MLLTYAAAALGVLSFIWGFLDWFGDNSVGAHGYSPLGGPAGAVIGLALVAGLTAAGTTFEKKPLGVAPAAIAVAGLLVAFGALVGHGNGGGAVDSKIGLILALITAIAQAAALVVAWMLTTGKLATLGGGSSSKPFAPPSPWQQGPWQQGPGQQGPGQQGPGQQGPGQQGPGQQGPGQFGGYGSGQGQYGPPPGYGLPPRESAPSYGPPSGYGSPTQSGQPTQGPPPGYGSPTQSGQPTQGPPPGYGSPTQSGQPAQGGQRTQGPPSGYGSPTQSGQPAQSGPPSYARPPQEAPPSAPPAEDDDSRTQTLPRFEPDQNPAQQGSPSYEPRSWNDERPDGQEPPQGR